MGYSVRLALHDTWTVKLILHRFREPPWVLTPQAVTRDGAAVLYEQCLRGAGRTDRASILEGANPFCLSLLPYQRSLKQPIQ